MIIDYIDIEQVFGLTFAKSVGEMSLPNIKKNVSYNWTDSHGIDEDLSSVYFEPRKISLDFLLKNASKAEFYGACMAFWQFVSSAGLHVLKYNNIERPYFVKVDENTNIDKLTSWNNSLNAGLFTLKLVEPKPINRVFYSIQTSLQTVSLVLTISNPETIFWGDGSKTIAYNSATYTHTYSTAKALYYIMVTGNATITPTNAIEIFTSYSKTNRNYLTNSAVEVVGTNGQYWGFNAVTRDLSNAFNIGDVITLSGFGKTANGSFRLLVRFKSNGTDDRYIYFNTSNYTQKSITVTVPADRDEIFVMAQVNLNGSDCYLKLLKLEKGSVVTDYTPAAEDVAFGGMNVKNCIL